MKLKTAKTIMYVLLGIFCLFMVMMALTKLPLFGYLAMGAVIVIGVINIAFWKCPYCGKSLGGLENFRHCRHCGHKIEL